MKQFDPPPTPRAGGCHTMMCFAVSLLPEDTDLEVMTGSSDWHWQKASFDMEKMFWYLFMTL